MFDRVEECDVPAEVKASWGPGPWAAEPDRVTSTTGAGYKCTLKRNRHSGAWLGYVDVPPGHPWHGVGYDDIECPAHGGLTYASTAPNGVDWRVGFDCAHSDDYAPGMVAQLRSVMGTYATAGLFNTAVYRTLAYAEREVRRVAHAAARAAR